MAEAKRNISVLIPYGLVSERELFHGIHRYAQGKREWHVMQTLLESVSPRWARESNCAGAIAVCWEPWRVLGDVAGAGISTVLASEPEPGFEHLPAVRTDERAVGRLAAEHLLERGHCNFAYFAEHVGGGWRAERLEGFRSVLTRARRDCTVYEFEEIEQGRGRDAAFDREMARILQAMPKPLAVFAANDWSAREIARQAKGCGLHVPGDIAIVGVDDQPQCELSDPPLTSVPLPYEAIGYRAAVQLDRMLQGEDVGTAAIRIPPTEIAVRTSSDSTAIDDREVLAAVQYMRANASRPGVDMADVSRVVAVSRRALERRFRKHFDESPAERFRRIRIDLAKRLLLDTTLTVGQIAVRSGFCNATVFCTTFRKLEATTPLAYRKRYGS